MGMDLVEIEIRMEAVFHLRLDHVFWQSLLNPSPGEFLDNTAAEQLQSLNNLTVGNLFERLVSRLKAAGWYGEDRTFEATQADLLETLRSHYRRDDLTPNTQLDSILIQKPNFQEWTEFTQLIACQLPDLIMLIRRWNPYFTAILLGLFSGLCFGWWMESVGLAVLVGCGIGFIAVPALDFRNYLISLDPRCRRIPPQIETIQLLAEHVYQSRYGKGMAAPWNEQTVWTAIQDILMHCLSVTREQIVPSARLIQDLGMD